MDEDEDGCAEWPSAPSVDEVGTTEGLGGAAAAPLPDDAVADALVEGNGPVGGIDGWNVVSSSRSLSYTTIVPFACETRNRFRLPGTHRMAVHGELVMHPCLFNRTYRVERGSHKISRVEAYDYIYAGG